MDKVVYYYASKENKVLCYHYKSEEDITMYKYENERMGLFTDEGQRLLLKVRDRVQKLLSTSGAFRMLEVLQGVGGDSSFQQLACIDRLIELKEIIECSNPISESTQHKIFIGLHRPYYETL